MAALIVVICLFLREENTFSRITEVYNVVDSLSRHIRWISHREALQ